MQKIKIMINSSKHVNSQVKSLKYPFPSKLIQFSSTMILFSPLEMSSATTKIHRTPFYTLTKSTTMRITFKANSLPKWSDMGRFVRRINGKIHKLRTKSIRMILRWRHKISKKGLLRTMAALFTHKSNLGIYCKCHHRFPITGHPSDQLIIQTNWSLICISQTPSYKKSSSSRKYKLKNWTETIARLKASFCTWRTSKMNKKTKHMISGNLLRCR